MVVEPGQDLHGHVLERQGGPVEQLQQPQPLIQLLQRGDGGVGEGLIGVLGHALEGSLVDLIPTEAGQDVGGQLGIAHPRIGGEVRGGELRPGLGDIEPAIGGQALENGVKEAGGGCAAAGGDITHQSGRPRKSMAR